VLRLYGLRMWVEQSYKQVKQAASLVAVPSPKRQSDPTALATGLLRVLVLLVSCQSAGFSHDASRQRALRATNSSITQRSG
jgi:hypothetical protein